MRFFIGMRNGLIISLVFWGLLAGVVFADDITQAEVIPDVVKWELDTVKMLAITKTCEVTYRKVDSNGDVTGLENKIIFKNVVDDPWTMDDETDNSFSQLINLINNESNIKQSITKAVKIKLNMP